jgi:hypothetical protein
VFAAWGNTAWLGLVNPAAGPVTLTVRVLREGGRPAIVRAVPVGAAARAVVGLHTWVSDEAFGVEVVCPPGPCVASLVMWDREWRWAHPSIPIVRPE